jgi:hypothetical protein
MPFLQTQIRKSLYLQGLEGGYSMKHLLTICPTWKRPHRLVQMLESFDKTKNEDTDILIYLSADDPLLEDYTPLIHNRRSFIGPRRYLTEALNYCFSIESGFQFYQEINDDHIYQTINWDKILTSTIETKGSGWGMSCGRDLIHDHNWEQHQLPSGLVISGNIPRALGYLVHPSFRHTYIDNFFRDIGKGIERFFYCQDVIIEHRHLIGGKVGSDENYKWVMSEEEMQYGRGAYEQWVKLYKQRDIERIKHEISRIN